MLHYHEITNTIENLNYDIVRDNKKVNYINMEAGFDIETTSYIQDETKTAFMYIWQFGIGYGNPIYYGRTWEEFQQLCLTLVERFQLNINRRLVIYVHNLGYEFQFMRKMFDWYDVFAVSERKPIKAVTIEGIEFRDSYILSGYSLANTAKNLATHKVKKMTGDLDYSLIRTYKTPLTTEEMGYCENDIQIILAYINEQIAYCGGIHKIPMTNTGRVRNYVRNNCYYRNPDGTKGGKGQYYKYRRIMESLTIDPATYLQLKVAFMGGFTHANANYSGQTLNDVSSIDFTSSYPAVMVSEKFPMSKFIPEKLTDLKHFETLRKTKALIFDIQFTNIRPRITQENYISESKCRNLKKAVINNGRISSAENLETTLTEIDMTIMEQAYTWDSFKIRNLKSAVLDYLPKPIIQSILNLYQDKTTLKDVQGSEIEYMLSKGMLNSIYGMSVTDIVKDQAIYTGTDWDVEKVDVEGEVAKYNESRNRFLYYPWGLWVTAYARRNLWTGIVAVGDDYVYSDTDSLKILNYPKHERYIKWFDNQIIKKMEAMCDHYKLDKSLLNPKTKDGVEKMLGIWDFEGTYSHFKTLGAKRYLTLENGKLALTVAGLSKQNGINYMLSQAGNDPIKVFDIFTDSLYIPEESTGKMTHTYIDHSDEFLITDYLGVKTYVKAPSGVHLESASFTLSIALEYKKFLTNLAKGYIFKGVKYE